MGVTNFYDGRGGFAERAVLQEATCFRVPDEMSDVDAAAFRIGYSTGWIGLVRRGGLTAGETLLVLGAAGGSGITAVQLGAALGATVLAVASGDERLDLCRRLGASVVIDRSAGGVADAVREATDGAGVDVVYDPVGGELAAEALGVLATNGRFLAVGFASGSWVAPEVHSLVVRNQSLVGVFAGGQTREQDEAYHEDLLALAAEGELAGFATVAPFDDLPAAVDGVARSTVLGKVVVQPGVGQELCR
jgi:NADPH2:quinone reductase